MQFNDIKITELKMIFDDLNGNLQLNANCLASLIEKKAIVKDRNFNVLNDETRALTVESLRKLVSTLNHIQKVIWANENILTADQAKKYNEIKSKQEEAFINLLKKLQ